MFCAGLQLRFDGHNVIVFHTLDPFELEFPFKGTWQFDGLEGEDNLITQPERIREDYLSNLNGFLDDIQSGCIGCGVDYALVDTSRPLDGLLSEFLENRSLNGMPLTPALVHEFSQSITASGHTGCSHRCSLAESFRSAPDRLGCHAVPESKCESTPRNINPGSTSSFLACFAWMDG